MRQKVSEIEEAKAGVSLRAYAEEHLEHAHGGLVCPCCGSGTGPNGTPAFSIEPEGERWKCFACGEGGDVLDLAGKILGTEDVREQIEAVGGRRVVKGSAPYRHKEPGAPAKRREETPADYREGRDAERAYIEASRLNMQPGTPGYDYLIRRGFTLEEIAGFGFGWDPQRQRVVIPWSTRKGEYYHIDRDITGNAKHKYIKPKKINVGPQPLHNAKALSGPAVFVVEGLMDALAVEAAGYPAIGLGGIGHEALIERVREVKYDGLMIVMLDNDKTGRENTDKLIDDLSDDEAIVWAVEYPGPDWGKDASEVLERDRPALKAFLAEELEKAEGARPEIEEERYREAMRHMRVLDPADTVAAIYALDNADDPVPTGIVGLDVALDGGLTNSVYVLGAISSLGKTTLTVQIADHIAENGRGVLFVTIEQSAREIVAKSLTRLMHAAGSDGAVSTRDLTSKRARDRWGARRNDLFLEACNRYTDTVAPNMRILEATEQPNVAQIKAIVEKMAKHDGRPPVVFIDYLQILAPQNERDSEKQATDRNMTALRRMAGDLRTPVFVISSLNRSSYSGSISIDSFKESGGIEYGADVLLGLQPAGMTETLDGLNDTKAKAEAGRIVRELKAAKDRPCEIVVLKNRNGSMPSRGIPVMFHADAATFDDGADLLPCDAGTVVL